MDKSSAPQVTPSTRSWVTMSRKLNTAPANSVPISSSLTSLKSAPVVCSWLTINWSTATTVFRSSTFVKTMPAGLCCSTASRSARPHSESIGLIRTRRSCLPKSVTRNQSHTSARTASLCWGVTESSRSRISASAGRPSALFSILSLPPGTKWIDLRRRTTKTSLSSCPYADTHRRFRRAGCSQCAGTRRCHDQAWSWILACRRYGW